MKVSFKSIKESLPESKRWLWKAAFVSQGASALLEASGGFILYVAFALMAGQEVEHLCCGAEDEIMDMVIYILAGLLFLKAAFHFAKAWLEDYTLQLSAFGLRKKLFRQRMRSAHVSSSEDATNELTAAVHYAVRDYAGSILRGSAEALILVALFAVLIWAKPVASLIGAGLIALALSPYFIFGQKRIRKDAQRHAAAHRTMLSAASDALNARAELHAYNAQELATKRFDTAAESLRSAHTRLLFMQATPNLLLEIVFSTAAVAAVIWAQGQAIGEELPYLALAVYAGFRAAPVANRLAQYIGMARHGAQWLQQLNEAENKHQPAYPDTGYKREKPEPFQSLDVYKLRFRYPSAKEPLLVDLRLKLDKGNRLGLAGPNGSGKTTLLHLLLGVLKPEDGDIRINDKKLTDTDGHWPCSIGYVPQQPYILDTTVEANILFGRKIDRDLLGHAIEAAGLEGLIESLPDKGLTRLGSGGRQLSGGEQRRLMLARALYGSPDVLLMDEPTVNLDHDSEKAFVDILMDLPHSVAWIISSHDPTLLARTCTQTVNLKKRSAS